ncbi:MULTISPECIES: hypothetical protein [unclassified Isoptericola]|uniref:hypothetical protein n=1 Tax=unclassified Isoptericola TaxID=2623355 RepID=UPI003661B1DD
MIIDDTTGAGDAARPALGTVLDAHARGYAQAVRLQLADLGPEVVDELTDGLEADLAEAYTDASAPLDGVPGRPDAADDVALDLAAHFGAAAAYAAELRTAAGLPLALPDAPGRSGKRSFAARRALVADRWRRAWHPVTSTPQWDRLRVLGRELRPAWWVARGWLVGAVLVAWFTDGRPSLVPGGVGELMAMSLAALVSVQWSRGHWLPVGWRARTTVAASVVAVLAVPAVASATYDGSVHGSTGGGGSYDAGYAAAQNDASSVGYGGYSGDDGVWVDGMQVSNLFAYDAHGDPIKDVQLFDDRGRPVRTMTDDGAQQAWSVPDVEGTWFFRPATADDGRSRWNVYPLRALPEAGMEWSDDGSEVQPPVGTQPEAMPWPFLKAPTSLEGAGAREDASEGDPGGGDADEGADGTATTPSTGGGATSERDGAAKGGRESSSAGAATDVRTSTAVAAGR